MKSWREATVFALVWTHKVESAAEALLNVMQICTLVAMHEQIRKQSAYACTLFGHLGHLQRLTAALARDLQVVGAVALQLQLGAAGLLLPLQVLALLVAVGPWTQLPTGTVEQERSGIFQG